MVKRYVDRKRSKMKGKNDVSPSQYGVIAKKGFSVQSRWFLVAYSKSGVRKDMYDCQNLAFPTQ